MTESSTSNTEKKTSLVNLPQQLTDALSAYENNKDQELNLSHIDLAALDDTQYETLCVLLPNLAFKKLNLAYCGLYKLTVARLKRLGAALAQCPQLEDLELTANGLPNIKGDCLTAFVELVSKCQQLKKLNLYNNGLNECDDEQWLALQTMTASLPQLQELNLSGNAFNEFTQQQWTHLFSLLLLCDKLKVLDVSTNNFKQFNIQWWAELADAVSVLKSLKTLKISSFHSNNIENDLISQLFGMGMLLQSLPGLKLMSMSMSMSMLEQDNVITEQQLIAVINKKTSIIYFDEINSPFFQLEKRNILSDKQWNLFCQFLGKLLTTRTQETTLILGWHSKLTSFNATQLSALARAVAQCKAGVVLHCGNDDFSKVTPQQWGVISKAFAEHPAKPTWRIDSTITLAMNAEQTTAFLAMAAANNFNYNLEQDSLPKRLGRLNKQKIKDLSRCSQAQLALETSLSNINDTNLKAKGDAVLNEVKALRQTGATDDKLLTQVLLNTNSLLNNPKEQKTQKSYAKTLRKVQFKHPRKWKALGAAMLVFGAALNVVGGLIIAGTLGGGVAPGVAFMVAGIGLLLTGAGFFGRNYNKSSQYQQLEQEMKSGLVINSRA